MTILYWIASLSFGILLGFMVYKKDKQKDVSARWLPALLRAITGTIVSLLLLSPLFSRWIKEEEKPIVVWLQDVSTSTDRALGNFKTSFLKERASLLSRLSSKYNVHQYGFGNTLEKDNTDSFLQKATDIAAALEQISMQYQDKNLGAIILASDGIYNQGSNPLYAQLSAPSNIYTIALGDSTTPIDLSVMGVYANKTVSLRNTFEIFADIKASGLAGKRSTAQLLHKGKVIASQDVSISGSDYATSISFAVLASEAGLQHYTVSLSAVEQERNLQNNSQSTLIEVREKRTKVLLMANAPHPDIGFIKRVLEDVPQYELKCIVNAQAPADINEYDMLIAYQTSPELPAGMPVWYIVGAQSKPDFLQLVKSKEPSAALAMPQDMTAELSSQFSLFRLPEGIGVTMPKLPPLNGSLRDIKAGSNSLMVTKSGEAIWNYYPGNIPFCILNGEGLWRWSMYEQKTFNRNEHVKELVLQTLNFLQTDKNEKPFQINVLKNNISDSEPAVIIAELRNANGELLNEPEAKLSISGNGSDMNYNFERSGNAYRINVGLLAPGTYKLKAQVSWNGKKHEDYGILHVQPIPLEALRTHSDFNLLHQIAQNNNGNFFTQSNFAALADSIMANNNIKTKIHTRSSTEAIINYRWLFFLILTSAAAEWLLRKYKGM